jgi:hypothetical protein
VIRASQSPFSEPALHRRDFFDLLWLARVVGQAFLLSANSYNSKEDKAVLLESSFDRSALPIGHPYQRANNGGLECIHFCIKIVPLQLLLVEYLTNLGTSEHGFMKTIWFGHAGDVFIHKGL